MKYRMYHGSPIKTAREIVDSGLLKYGCITRNKKKARVYCGESGILFSILVDKSWTDVGWKILCDMVHATIGRFEIFQDWAYNNFFPTDFEELIDEPISLRKNDDAYLINDLLWLRVDDGESK